MVGLGNLQKTGGRKMKKLLLMMTVLIFTLLSGCSSSDPSNASDKDNTEETDQEQTNESVEVDKGLLNVEVTLPASMFEGEDVDATIAEVEKEGVEATKNEDGSVTYKMSKSKHKEMMKELETGIIESIEDMKNNEDFVSIQEITYNKSFSEFTMVVDKATYENSMDSFVIFGLGLSGMYYQLFNGADEDDYRVKIIVKDKTTDEVMEEVIYPDSLQDEETK
jgi:major membrane immunogen (membrane-anchored lipoprotein)